MNNSAPQSWYDFPAMQPMDPRSIVQVIQLTDNAAAVQTGQFQYSGTWLQTVTWGNPPIATSPFVPGTIPIVSVPNVNDYESQNIAIAWNASHAMTVNNNKLPVCVNNIMFLKAGTAYVNTLFFDWTGIITATDIQFSFRDNSVTSGMFMNGATGLVPVFTFPSTSTYGAFAMKLQVTLLQPGRYTVGLRIHDSAGTWSLYEMQWIVL